MEDTIFYALVSLLSLLLAYKIYCSITSHKRLPPSPPSLPIIGHLHLLKLPIFRTFHKLSQKYGPVMSLKFGSRLAVVVSSPSAAEECFSKNDVVLANRPDYSSPGKYIMYDNSTLFSAPYGDHWRHLRRIVFSDIFSTQRFNSFSHVRRDEVKRLLWKLCDNSRQDFVEVELKTMFSDLAFNIIMRMATGKRYFGDNISVEDQEKATQFKEIISDLFRIGGTTNSQDLLPIVKWVSGGSYEKQIKKLASRADKFVQDLIDERRKLKQIGSQNNTMIDHLLSLQETQPEYYTDDMIKGNILVVLLGGTDTSGMTLEWVMSNLLNNPNFMHKAREELESKIGQDRLLEESDLSELNYLQNIILETLRLYPPAPALVPHFSTKECTIGGYRIPKGTTVFTNAWAIHRDPALWEDPEVFKPERFESNGQGDQAYKFMPFGLGRRACPGSGMAQRVVGLTMGSLIQCFEWKRIGEELVDMAESPAVNLLKAQPLVAMCKSRDIVKNRKIFAHDVINV